MKLTGLILIVVLMLSSCGSSQRIHTLELEDGFPTISLLLPIEFDTTYSWFETSDNDCDDLYKYRISNTNTTFSDVYHKPGLRKNYQLTISHKRERCGNSDDIPDLQSELESKIYKVKRAHPDNKIEQEGIVKINGNDFVYFSKSLRTIENYKDYKLYATVFLNNRRIDLEFECANENCHEFNKDAFESINSIKIND